MSKPQDYFGSSPKSVLNKPFFHAQDQKAYNVDGGTSIADAWTKRTLNTVIHNDIQGASLASDQVNLPAGTYYVEAESVHFVYNMGNGFAIGIFDSSNKLLQGSSSSSTETSSTSSTAIMSVSGVVTLSSPGTIELRYYTGVTQATHGLGQAGSAVSIADPTVKNVYADLKIWQLDRSLEIAPKAINSGLQTIAGMNTEGNIMGFDVTVSGNTLTITKGSCMSSDLTVLLAFTTDKTCVLPGTVNGDFYVFAVRLLDGVTYEARAYSTYAGPSSDAQIDKWRFISFAKNNGSGVTYPYKQTDGEVWFTATQLPCTGALGASYNNYDISLILPVGLLINYLVAGAADRIQVSFNQGGNHHSFAYGMDPIICPPLAILAIRYASSATTSVIPGFTLRR